VARVRDDGLIEGAPGAPRDPERLRAAVDEAAEAEAHRETFERSRVEMMRAYAETDGCRRAFVLSYFGEAFEPPCGNCDVCEAAAAAGEPVAEVRPPAGVPGVGERVRHAEWGAGLVARYEDGQLTVVFDTVGYKTLDVGLVAERGLLEPADAPAAGG
jgi:ATP-dependent DNA helicase RecQ